MAGEIAGLVLPMYVLASLFFKWVLSWDRAEKIKGWKVEGLLKESGLSGGDINGLTQGLNPVSPTASIEEAGKTDGVEE